MTVKRFIEVLEEELENRFVVHTNSDPSFSHLPDNEIAIVGENENEIFAVSIVKVDMKEGDKNEPK